MHKDDKEDKGTPRVPYGASIRRRLTRIVFFPSAALLVAWLAVSGYSIYNGFYVRQVAASVRDVSIPAANVLATLQQEREVSLQYLDNPALGQSELPAQRKATDDRLTALQSAFAATISNAPPAIAAKVNALRLQFGQLNVLRPQIDSRSIDRTKVNNYYNGVLDTASNLFDTQARIVPDAAAASGGITATSVFRASDNMSRETSLVSTALSSGTFNPDDFVQFTQVSGYYRTQLAQIAPFLDPQVSTRYQALTSGPAWRQLTAAEDALVRHGPGRLQGVPVAGPDWQAEADEVSGGLNSMALDQADKVSVAAIDSGDAQLRDAIIGIIIALILFAGVISFTWWRARSLADRTLVIRLARLRDDAFGLAGRLPTIVRPLRSGEPVDVNSELPQLDYGQDEIGQVAEAFNIAQRTAVNAAVSEANARNGLHNVFIGLARRSQGLVQSLLTNLDQMESQEHDSTRLKMLFRLDHLAARLRRNDENLLILGGERPGRRWRRPVLLREILRSAAGEVEQYTRVKVEHEQVPNVSIRGEAVGDTIRLLSELVDNATEFSNPPFPVEVTSGGAAHGVVVEVTDRGLGMKGHALQWANKLMADPPEFDDMSQRADASLGLFVVARLAAKREFSVTFEPSRYGGVRVTVLIPTRWLADPENNADSVVAADPAIQWPPVSSPTSQPVLESPLTDRHPADDPVHAPDNGDGGPTRYSAPSPVDSMSSALDTEGLGALVDASSADLVFGQNDEDNRPPLPVRTPGGSMVPQLVELSADAQPDSDGTSAEETSSGTLTTFLKGSRRERNASDG